MPGNICNVVTTDACISSRVFYLYTYGESAFLKIFITCFVMGSAQALKVPCTLPVADPVVASDHPDLEGVHL